MNKLQKIAFALAAVSAVSLGAQENLLKFGDFENLPAGRVNMVKSMVKGGLDINRDAVCVTPGWRSKKAPSSIKIVDASADKNAVKSGKNALNVKTPMMHVYTQQMFPLGEYEISFAYKGKGSVGVCLYYYSAKHKHLGNSNRKANMKASADWQTYTGKITVAADKKEAVKARFVFIFDSSDITIDDIVIKPVK